MGKTRTNKKHINKKSKLHKKRKTHKNVLRGGTGIFFDVNNEDYFREFLENSDIYFLSRGSYGIALRVVAFPSYVSKYLDLDPDRFGRPIKELIIKIGIISSTNPKTIVHKIDEEDFETEVNIQTDIFLKTMQYLSPICPAIVYAKILDDINFITQIIHNIKRVSESASKRLTDNFLNGLQKYFLIGMEMATGYDLMYEKLGIVLDKNNRIIYFPNREEYIWIYCALIRLAIETGYAHQDFHLSNIMYNEMTNETMLLDFGRTVKIPPSVLEEISENYRNKNYVAILDKICRIPAANGLNVGDPLYANHYGFVCNPNSVFPELTAVKINNLIENHFIRIDDDIQMNIDDFSEQTDRSKYPLLPLSNAIKNKMFPGIIKTLPFVYDKINVDKVKTIIDSDTFTRAINLIYDIGKNQPINATDDTIKRACFIFADILQQQPIKPYKLDELTSFMNAAIIIGFNLKNFAVNDETNIIAKTYKHLKNRHYYSNIPLNQIGNINYYNVPDDTDDSELER